MAIKVCAGIGAYGNKCVCLHEGSSARARMRGGMGEECTAGRENLPILLNRAEGKKRYPYPLPRPIPRLII